MAGPIGHIVFLAKIFDEYFSDLVKKDFFIGTSFPDIRYLRVIEREKTHFNHVTLSDIRKNDAFMSGVKFHSLVDEIRERYMEDHDIYSLCPESKYITQSLKILEDEIYYSSIQNWDEYIQYLNEILPEQVNFGVRSEDVRRWHTFLQHYFVKQPNLSAVKSLCSDLGFSKEAAEEMITNIEQMKTNKKIVEVIKNLYIDFDFLLKGVENSSSNSA